MDTFEEAQAIRGYEEKSIIAMCLFANLHQSKQDRKAIKAAWDCDPRPYARAVDMMPGWFDGSVDVSKFELLSLIKIASVRNKFARALLAEEWKRLTLSFDDVRVRVDEVNKPKPREKQDKPDLKRIGDNLAAVVRSNHLQGQVDYDFECHVCKCLKAWEELP